MSEGSMLVDFKQLPYVDMGHAQVPLYWMNEQSGILKESIQAFLEAGMGKSEISPEQFELVRGYLEYVIKAPCWQEPPLPEKGTPTLAELRREIVEAKTTKELDAWLHRCLKLGIDPL
jgi:hypothetical protein